MVLGGDGVAGLGLDEEMEVEDTPGDVLSVGATKFGFIVEGLEGGDGFVAGVGCIGETFLTGVSGCSCSRSGVSWTSFAGAGLS